MAVRDQMRRARTGTAHVVAQDGVRLASRARRPIGEDRLDPGVELGCQVAVVVPRRHDDQPVHAAGAEGEHEIALPVRVLLGRAGEQQIAVVQRGVLDGAVEAGIEGVGHVFDDQADARRTAPAQDARAVVAAVAEALDRRQHAARGNGVDAGLVVDDAGDGLERHAGRGGHVVHGRTAASRLYHGGIISHFTALDNVVSVLVRVGRFCGDLRALCGVSWARGGVFT